MGHWDQLMGVPTTYLYPRINVDSHEEHPKNQGSTGKMKILPKNQQSLVRDPNVTGNP